MTRTSKEPSATRLAKLPDEANAQVMEPYSKGPTMEDTFPEKANRPKNWPRFSSGVSCTISVREVTHMAPMETP
ncbi:hypothetical protein D3C86_2202470 [compost metagenome]